MIARPALAAQERPAPLPVWELTPAEEAREDHRYWEQRYADPDDETEPDDEPT